jgi:hypothetical protein
MLNKIVLLLSMTLNLVLALIVFQNNKPIKAVDFRDALSDTPATSQLMNNSLASLTPAPVAQVGAVPVPLTPAVAAPGPLALAQVQVTTTVSDAAPEAAAVPAPVKTAAPIKTAALMIKGGNDWAAYKQDAADDSDVYVSNIFRSRKRGEKAVLAAVKRTKARGKDVLFSCVLTEKSGGVFYVIRMSTPVIHPPQAVVATRWKSDEPYSNDLSAITSKAESEIQVMY